jgi:hypothetical protein
MDQTAYRNPYSLIAAEAPIDERASFIRNTYIHLAGAIGVFGVLCAILVNSPLAPMMTSLIQSNRWTWLLFLFGFMGVSYVADSWARSDTSKQMQYVGLSLYIVAEAIIFTPLLFIAHNLAPQVIPMAGVLTIALFLALTAVAFITRKDFSFLGGILSMAFFVGFGLILCSILFGFELPSMLFSGVFILLAGGAILYNTSNIIHVYRTDQYVAASLGLFAAVALMFWYMIQFLLSFSSSRD